jgi:hypothetical protein
MLDGLDRRRVGGGAVVEERQVRVTRHGLTVTCDYCKAQVSTYEDSQHDCERFFSLLGWGKHDGKDECMYCKQIRTAMDNVKALASRKVLVASTYGQTDGK